MRLYLVPGGGSLAPHIVAREAGVPIEPVRVDLQNKRLPDGRDYLAVNPKGQIPALELDNGELLTEGAVILQYLAEQAPDSGLLPPDGSMQRWRVLEWLNYLATEMHKNFGPLFKPGVPEDYKSLVREQMNARFAYLSTALGERAFLVGEHFTVADAYLFTVLGWCRWVGLSLAAWPNLVAYLERIAARPKVAETLAAEKG